MATEMATETKGVQQLKRKACVVAYDGDRAIFNGWQTQSIHQSPRTTVADTITNALNTIYKGNIKIMGSGRTDAGVHALGQVFHFDPVNYNIHAEALTKALNTKLPPTIRILKTVDVDDNFHASRSATSKTYKYRLVNSQSYNDASPFNYRYAWHYPLKTMLPKRYLNEGQHHDEQYLVLNRLNKILALYQGEKDYASFCASRSLKGDNTYRTIISARASLVKTSYDDGGCGCGCGCGCGVDGGCGTNGHTANGYTANGYTIDIFITGDGFMHRMVRSMVGLAVVNMRDYQTDDQLKARMDEVFSQRNRAKAGYGAPPNGLYLHSVNYDNNPEMG